MRVACSQCNHSSIDAVVKGLAPAVNVSFRITEDVSLMIHNSVSMALLVRKLKKQFLINFLTYRKRKLSREHQFSTSPGSRSLSVPLMFSRLMPTLFGCHVLQE
jgi:hypothetical protein